MKTITLLAMIVLVFGGLGCRHVKSKPLTWEEQQRGKETQQRIDRWEQREQRDAQAKAQDQQRQ